VIGSYLAVMVANVPIEVRQFLAKHIKSLEQLEVLLLVSALPDREWSADAVYKVVLSNPAIVATRLDDFVKAGIFTRSGDPPLYRYAPSSQELQDQIAALSAAYKIVRHKIVELIYRTPSDSMQAFSDAFKFKRDK
jgi:hypothetical protein